MEGHDRESDAQWNEWESKNYTLCPPSLGHAFHFFSCTLPYLVMYTPIFGDVFFPGIIKYDSARRLPSGSVYSHLRGFIHAFFLEHTNSLVFLMLCFASDATSLVTPPPFLNRAAGFFLHHEFYT